ncbi:MAG: hypothetical protein KKB20_20100 [Proteobacteria bacterium]|nr:hypothetical protein [Pseudomonadota bacterium]
MDINRPEMTALLTYSTRVTATANNLANMESRGYKAQRVHTVELPGGGVSVTVSQDISPGRPIVDPEGLPGSEGPLEGSNVDPGREMIDLITTQRYFEANARALRSIEETRGQVLDIVI